jgi:hypothetical protein
MARTEIIRGGTIRITAVLSNSLVSDFDNIIVEAYTSKTNPVKFSILELTGHLEIIVVNTTTFYVKLLSDKTKLMKGDLFYQIKGIIGDKDYILEDNGTGRIDTTVTLIE